MFVSLKVVTPVKTGVQGIYKSLEILDSGFRRKDGRPQFQTFYKIIKVRFLKVFIAQRNLIFSER